MLLTSSQKRVNTTGDHEKFDLAKTKIAFHSSISRFRHTHGPVLGGAHSRVIGQRSPRYHTRLNEYPNTNRYMAKLLLRTSRHRVHIHLRRPFRLLIRPQKFPWQKRA
jgi:hypothetical protein